jgi:predicted RecB family nuclease
MKKIIKNNNVHLQLSATDLSNYLSCKHLTHLDQMASENKIVAPPFNNPHADVLKERGLLHEANYVEYLCQQYGMQQEKIDTEDKLEGFQKTINLMQQGVDLIIQGVLKLENWYGRTDILKKVATPSKFGAYSYEVIDTKLSRETKAGAILQLCLYSEMLEEVQGGKPEHLFVVTPGSPFNEQCYRVDEYQSYYRQVRDKLLDALKVEMETYPDPVEHCDVCRWFDVCDKKRREDDHLSFVAGLSNSNRKDLIQIGINKLADLAKSPDDFYKTISDANPESYQRIHEQAKLQLEARDTGSPRYELLKVEPERGFNRLPVPSEGDIFFDLEGDQFYQENGIEYLWGFSTLDQGKLTYHSKFAFNYAQEKEAFEWFMSYVGERKKQYPNLKIYHYSPYEPSALKRLMGRYSVLENEVDHLLRTQSFVDLYGVVRQSIRAGIEKYSIKDLEQFYKFVRQAELRGVGVHKRSFEHAIELGEVELVASESIKIVQDYNQDDCDSTYYLRNWLEELRASLEVTGAELSRPSESSGEVQEELSDEIKRLQETQAALQSGISSIPEERSHVQNIQWLLGDLIGFYRREDKVNFWEKFRLKELDSFELLSEKAGISGLTFIDTVGGTAKCPIHRYSFIDQIIDLKTGVNLYREGILEGEEFKSFGTIKEINFEENTIDIKKTEFGADFHPNACFAWSSVSTKVKAERLLDLADFVIANGLESDKPQFKAARDILLRQNPTLKAVMPEHKEPLEMVKWMAHNLNHSYLAIQGPPGTGKSYTASRMILSLIQAGHRVGVTGLSHKVISNLLAKVSEAAIEAKASVEIFQKVKDKEDETNPSIQYINPNKLKKLIGRQEPFILGGTDFMWAASDMQGMVDYLVVDEAGQFSLVGIMAISHATQNIVLLGDGAQLQQPIQGSHPDGCEVSALDHVCFGYKTLPKEKGVFLPVTYRLHPKICEFNSELFYENRLNAIAENICQTVQGNTAFKGVHLSYVEASHWGNSNYAPEEVELIKKIIQELTNGKITYTLYKDKKVVTHTITESAIMVIAPYNSQVNRIKQALPNIRVGTVDKFQGQEAPIVIYSVTTSSPEDAPRGMDFLYSGNRLNVAVSRAECLFIMVATKQIFEPNCKSPAQMKLANAYCRYLEMAKKIEL